jgi:hypothetical protein
MADPYVLDIPAVVGNIDESIANLTALRAELTANPKPTYSVHGHNYDWVGMYKYISGEIEALLKQRNQVAPWEIVSIAR